MMDPLSQPVQYIKGVGPAKAKLLNKLGLFTVYDLLTHYPRDYEDRTNPRSFHQLVHGEKQGVIGTVKAVRLVKPRPRFSVLKVILSDGRSVAEANFFNQPYLQTKFHPGQRLYLTGKVDLYNWHVPQIDVADYELEDGDDLAQNRRIRPIYPSTEGLGQRQLRAIIARAVKDYSVYLPEIFGEEFCRLYSLLPRHIAVARFHSPDTWEELAYARRRLAFEELFVLLMGLNLLKAGLARPGTGFAHRPDDAVVQNFEQNLPFALTPDQKKVLAEIKQDMEKPVPMHRLVQGDVGSGKTIVAAIALLKAVRGGYQGAMMAPTEILAEQHYDTFSRLLHPYGVKVALLVGGQAKKERQEILTALQDGSVDIVIGTHALIEKEVEFKNLGLVVTDEQHRFGVRQRGALQQKGQNPDVLVMTATPIPRTLALTIYGDLDVSTIRHLPPGRKPIITRFVRPDKRALVFDYMARQIRQGRQGYVVCPLVEESEKLEAEAAVQYYEKLSREVFPQFKVALLHGRMKGEEKQKIIRAFRDGEIQILVSTTVIEVGVNVPNASLMVIENADRFGLAQLHQLRGRVGRGSYQSLCVLIADPQSEEGKKRMEAMVQYQDGFLLAEKDLELRGPGEFLGTRQHGLPDLKVADLLRDVELIQEVRQAVNKLAQSKDFFTRPEYKGLRDEILKKFAAKGSQIPLN